MEKVASNPSAVLGVWDTVFRIRTKGDGDGAELSRSTTKRAGFPGVKSEVRMSDELMIFLLVFGVIGIVVFVAFLGLCRRVGLLLERAVALDAHAADHTRYLASISVSLARLAGGAAPV